MRLWRRTSIEALREDERRLERATGEILQVGQYVGRLSTLTDRLEAVVDRLDEGDDADE